MAVIGIDLGGTKIRSAVFSAKNDIYFGPEVRLCGAKGDAVTELIQLDIQLMITEAQNRGEIITSAGIAVPGIWNEATGTAWVPNIPGWENYPLRKKLQEHFNSIDFYFTNDRACYILGEVWKGKAVNCKDAVFLAAGTGIAAGILINGEILNGSTGAAGAVGWMALKQPFEEKYISVGCNEYYASGPGLVRYAREVMESLPAYNGLFQAEEKVTPENLIDAFDKGDEVAVKVINNAIEIWGMCVANLVSTFNPEMVILGGGVFSGDGSKFLHKIHAEALKWGQPVSMQQVKLEVSAHGELAGLYGAVYYALESERKKVIHV